jgi:hypothetical protein
VNFAPAVLGDWSAFAFGKDGVIVVPDGDSGEAER